MSQPNDAILKPVSSPELFFGIVAPLGVDMDLVESALAESLAAVKYDNSVIKITDNLTEIDPSISLPSAPFEDRIRSRIEKCNELCTVLGRFDAMSLLAVSCIQRLRRDRGTFESDDDASSDSPMSRHAFVIRQLKRPEEIAFLRMLYGSQFYCISFYLDKHTRAESLAKRIFDSTRRSIGMDQCRSHAWDLISIDESQEAEEFGQRVRDSFPKSDIIIDARNKETMLDGLNRAIKLIFGYEFISPTKEEYGMYAAKTASLRSRDLSRQVGAAIFTPTGEVVSLGCNEVPRAGGGTYWEGDSDDSRDLVRKLDYSAKMKTDIAHDIEQKVSQMTGSASTSVTHEQLRNHILESSMLGELLEFGRIVHAEMNAITDAARLGHSINNNRMFTTTFPCHMCARHIISSGLSEVIYWEPYAKSKAEELYDDALSTRADWKSEKKVGFRQFIGITPNRYSEFFSMKKRRKQEASGEIASWESDAAEPNPRILLPAYLASEKYAHARFGELVAEHFPH